MRKILAIALFLQPPAYTSQVVVDSSALREAVSASGIVSHLEQFQSIATANDNTRFSGTAGYADSVAYVVKQLETSGYYTVTTQEFGFALSSRPTGPAVLRQIEPNSVTYSERSGDFTFVTDTDPGDVTAPVTPIRLRTGDFGDQVLSDGGCAAHDFANFPAGNIALMQGGGCSVRQKAENAASADAVGAIIMDQYEISGSNDRLGNNYNGGIPVFEASFSLGKEWATTEGLVVNMVIDLVRERQTALNVLAETLTGRDDQVILVGAHLDSVEAGPGINDNGSGSATILEIALQMSKLGIVPENKVRFAWFGGEEMKHIGSAAYVESLGEQEIEKIAVMLNFDMVGSPNYVRFVDDGNGSSDLDRDVAGPPGSAEIEQVFLDYFASQGLPVEPIVPRDRSDSYTFAERGIPVGGIHSGTDIVKTDDQADIYCGTAGEPYDPCYHRACDDIDNINRKALDEMSDAAAHAVLIFASKVYPDTTTPTMSPALRATSAPTTAPTTSPTPATSPTGSPTMAGTETPTRRPIEPQIPNAAEATSRATKASTWMIYCCVWTLLSCAEYTYFV